MSTEYTLTSVHWTHGIVVSIFHQKCSSNFCRNDDPHTHTLSTVYSTFTTSRGQTKQLSQTYRVPVFNHQLYDRNICSRSMIILVIYHSKESYTTQKQHYPEQPYKYIRNHFIKKKKGWGQCTVLACICINICIDTCCAHATLVHSCTV